jgi:nitrous oxidase accessory protein NosD
VNQKAKVLATLIELYETGRGTLVVDVKHLARATDAAVEEVQYVVHAMWSQDYLAYENGSFRLTESGYRKYLREVERLRRP